MMLPQTSAENLWRRYQKQLISITDVGVTVDFSRAGYGDGFVAEMYPRLQSALQAMRALEGGDVANIDEDRMVGHYWLRDPQQAPNSEIRSSIKSTIEAVTKFITRVHSKEITGTCGAFTDVIHVGIGGSSLGPQFVCDALSTANDRLRLHFLDNADPDGIYRLLTELGPSLGRTLVSVVSKSGWTPTPMHVMKIVRSEYEARGLEFRLHAVATTMPGTDLDVLATEDSWLSRFHIWDWVGGRTSVTSAVGLLPLGLQRQT